jgi:hypothetical protein
MNDLDLIREFRGEVEEPDAEAAERARAAVMAAIAEPSVRAPARPRRLRTARRRWPVMVGAVAAATAAALVVTTSIPRGDTGGAPSAVAAVLHRAALAAASQPNVPAPRPGQYVYTKSRSLYEADTYDVGKNHKQYFRVVTPQTREAWIATNGSGRLRERTGTPRFLSAHDRLVWIAAGRPDLGGNRTTSERFSHGPQGLYYVNLFKLPTDPAKLAKLIDERKIEGGPPGDAETFVIIGDLLRETYGPPKVRAALYDIASELPEVRLLGRATWTARPGIAVGFPTGDYRQEIVFDPKTGAMLGERTVNMKTGKVADFAVYLASGLVDSTSQTTHKLP